MYVGLFSRVGMKIAFYGLGAKAYHSIRAFIERHGGDCISAVIAARDPAQQADHYVEMKALCEEHSVAFFDRNESYVHEDGVVQLAIGWRWMLDSENLVVFHDSLLPKYRGFAPLVNALINGDASVGVTALHASKHYDAGPIIFQQHVPISYPITIQEAIDQVTRAYEDLVERVYQTLCAGNQLPSIEQDHSQATFSLWRDEQDYFMPWEQSAELLKRFCDAVGYPYAGARTYLGGDILLVLKVEIMPDVQVEMRNMHIGKVIFMDQGCPVVVCGEGLLKIIEYRFADGRSNSSIPFRSRFSGRQHSV